jgi:XapX domain-containing protein
VNARAVERIKTVLGLLLGLGIGAGCRYLDVPSPAPPVLQGALLVVAMTLGYIAADRWMGRHAPKNLSRCGGPDGSTRSGARRAQSPAEH